MNKVDFFRVYCVHMDNEFDNDRRCCPCCRRRRPHSPPATPSVPYWSILLFLLLIGFMALFLGLQGSSVHPAAAKRRDTASHTQLLEDWPVHMPSPEETRINLPVQTVRGSSTWTLGQSKVWRNGIDFRVRGMNWYGMETDKAVLEGLWERDIRDYLDQMHDLGVNVLRIPWAVEGLFNASWSSDAPYFRSIDVAFTHGCSSCGPTPIDILDQVFSIANDLEMDIILDLHRLHFKATSMLWFDHIYSKEHVLMAWKWMLSRYKDCDNFAGMDLYNEPHGKVTFGSGSPESDFLLFLQVAVDELYTPLLMPLQKLVFVNGIKWGEDMRDFGQHLPTAYQSFLVLSPHSYGPTLTKPIDGLMNDPQLLWKRWITYFGYLQVQGWTLVIGEWGGNQDFPPDVLWMREYVNFLKSWQLAGQCFWAWNPDSKDVKGFLQSDWKEPVPVKLAFWKLLQETPYG